MTKTKEQKEKTDEFSYNQWIGEIDTLDSTQVIDKMKEIMELDFLSNPEKLYGIHMLTDININAYVNIMKKKVMKADTRLEDLKVLQLEIERLRAELKKTKAELNHKDVEVNGLIKQNNALRYKLTNKFIKTGNNTYNCGDYFRRKPYHPADEDSGTFVNKVRSTMTRTVDEYNLKHEGEIPHEQPKKKVIVRIKRKPSAENSDNVNV